VRFDPGPLLDAVTGVRDRYLQSRRTA
jgi:hypothetical protein